MEFRQRMASQHCLWNEPCPSTGKPSSGEWVHFSELRFHFSKKIIATEYSEMIVVIFLRIATSIFTKSVGFVSFFIHF